MRPAVPVSRRSPLAASCACSCWSSLHRRPALGGLTRVLAVLRRGVGESAREVERDGEVGGRTCLQAPPADERHLHPVGKLTPGPFVVVGGHDHAVLPYRVALVVEGLDLVDLCLWGGGGIPHDAAAVFE